MKDISPSATIPMVYSALSVEKPVVVSKDHSEGLWKLPASRISTSSEEITVSPQATGRAREVRNNATRTDAALEYPMGPTTAFPASRRWCLASSQSCKTVEIRADSRPT